MKTPQVDIAALVAMIEEANSDEDFRKITRELKAMPAPEGQGWLKTYYLGLCYVLHSMEPVGAVKRDSLVTMAEAQAAKLLRTKPQWSEAHTLRAFCYQAKIMVAVWARGPMYLSDVEQCLNKALKLDPENPRALFLQAQTLKNKPVFFGGGESKARPVLNKALECFDNAQPESPLHPSWGKGQALELLEELK